MDRVVMTDLDVLDAAELMKRRPACPMKFT
jgi:hypothetical protein